jgi:hypothetical protein
MLVRRSGSAATAVRVDAAPVVLAVVCGAGAVREELAECVLLSWRLPVRGDGARSAWASDGPWQAMVRSARAGDYDARGGDMDGADDAGDASHGALTVEQLARIDRAAGWMASLADRPAWQRGLTMRVNDGALVAAVARHDAMNGGGGRTDWAAVAGALNLPAGRGDRLRMRHARALHWLAARVGRGALVREMV